MLPLALAFIGDQEDVDDLLKILDAGPLMASMSGRITGRQAQTMPMQGSTKESITAGACLQRIIEGSLTALEVMYVRAIEAEISL